MLPIEVLEAAGSCDWDLQLLKSKRSAELRTRKSVFTTIAPMMNVSKAGLDTSQLRVQLQHRFGRRQLSGTNKKIS